MDPATSIIFEFTIYADRWNKIKIHKIISEKLVIFSLRDKYTKSNKSVELAGLKL